MGSPLYMSPEQMTASREVDARTDVWAIGVVLYELLAGRPPFRAETLPEICGLILTTAPPAIRNFSPSTPEPLQLAVLRCLEKDRARRFQSVSELAQAIAPFGSRATSRSVERISRILGASAVHYESPASVPHALHASAGTQSNRGQTASPRSDTMPLMVAGAAAVVLLGGLGALWFFRSKPAATEHDVAAAASQVSATAPVVSQAAPVQQPAAVPAPVAAPPPTPPAAVAPPSKPIAVEKVAKAAAAKPPSTKPAPLSAPSPAPAPPPHVKKSAEDMMSGRD